MARTSLIDIDNNSNSNNNNHKSVKKIREKGYESDTENEKEKEGIKNKTTIIKEWMPTMMFGLDIRSLTLMRVCLSVIIILDLYVRSLYMHDHYSKWSVVPVSLTLTRSYSFSFLFINSSPLFLFFLFFLNSLSSLSLLFGYKTRLSCFLCWLFMLSLHNRNPLVLNAGDDVIRLFLFWSMFLPLGKCASIDSMMNTKPTKFESKYFLSFATIATMGQFCLIYWFTAVIKTGPEWNVDYTATYYALHIDQFATSWAVMLREYVTLTKLLTIGVIYWEKIGPFLFFIPIRLLHGPLRTFAVLGFLALHFGFGTCLELGFFMYIPGACVVSFLPSWFWDTLLNFFRRSERRLSVSIYYDSENTIAYKILLLFRTFFLLHETPILPTNQYELSNEKDSNEKNGRNDSYDMSYMHNHEYWFSVTDNSDMKIEYGYDAVLKLISISPLLFIFRPILKLRPFRSMYNYVSSHFGQVLLESFNRHTPNKPYEDPNKSIRWASSLLALLLFIYVVNWNFAGLYQYSVPQSIRWVGPALKLDQWWGMFAPHPPKRDGWYVMPAELKDGTKIDIFTGEPITYEKPELVSAMYPTQRWRKYLMNLQRDTNKEKRLYYGRYLCREWNFWGRHTKEKELVRYKIILMVEITPQPGDPPQEITQLVLWEHEC